MLTVVEDIGREFRQALRRLGREWAFTAAFVVTLALGIAANTTVFSALDAYLFHPLPYPRSGRLVNIYANAKKDPLPNGIISAAAYRQILKLPAVANGGLIADYGKQVTVVMPGKRPQSLAAAWVTASVFTTLGVQPLLGRFLGQAADRPDGPKEVVLSYRLWQSAFGASSHVLGKTMRLRGKLYTIVGVMPQSFAFPDRATLLWLPAVLKPVDFSMQRFTDFSWNMIARLAPGASQADLQTQLNALVDRFEQTMPPSQRGMFRKVGAYGAEMSWRQWTGGSTAGNLVVMQLGAVLLLLLAVASLTNLALVRALQRRGETALRMVLGAGRRRLLLTTFMEALSLAVAATLLSWPLARLGTNAFVHFGIASDATLYRLSGSADIWLIAFFLALALSAAALALPQLFIRRRRTATLMANQSRSGEGGRGVRRVRMGLSIAQIALAVLLLAGASLLGLSVRNMLNPNPGFNARGLYVATLNLQGPQYRNWKGWHSAQQRLAQAIERIPGVTHSAIGNGIPFTRSGSSSGFQPAHHKPSTLLPHNTFITLTTPRLMRTLGVKLVAGRLIERSDLSSGAHVAVVDERLAKALLGSTNVVGQQILGGGFTWRIVGVVGSIEDQFASYYASGGGTIFVPDIKATYEQWGGATTILLRSHQSASVLEREVRKAVHDTLPDQSLLQFRPMQKLIAESAQGTSALASLLIAFGLLAFVLASVGTYGVIAYVAGLRKREFAIRQALGATPARIEILVIAQGVALWFLGVLFGVGCALFLGRFLEGLLYRVSLLTPGPYLVPALVLGLVVVAASWLPARRARRLDLLSVLRPQ